MTIFFSRSKYRASGRENSGLTYDGDKYKETEHDSSQDDWYIDEDWIFHSCVRGLIDVSLHHG